MVWCGVAWCGVPSQPTYLPHEVDVPSLVEEYLHHVVQPVHVLLAALEELHELPEERGVLDVEERVVCAREYAHEGGVGSALVVRVLRVGADGVKGVLEDVDAQTVVAAFR